MRLDNRAGFAHLSKIQVDVYSGDFLRDECERQPYTCFNWFGPALPPTIESVSDEDADPVEVETFRSYLSGRQLDYYSRGKVSEWIPASASDISDRIGNS